MCLQKLAMVRKSQRSP